MTREYPFTGRSVFKNQRKLQPRYIPNELIHRKAQLKQLRNIFKEAIIHPESQHMKVIQLIGPTGSGKTSTAHHFSTLLEREARRLKNKLSVIHVNCKLEARTRANLYRRLLSKAIGRDARGYPAEEYLSKLLEHLHETNKYLLVILDDVDHLIRNSSPEKQGAGVVYDMTRLNELDLAGPAHVLGVVFIAKDHSFLELLDPSERSSLGNLVVRLPHYDRDQLIDILEARAKEAFRPGAVSRNLIEYVADLASGRKEDPGDCRYALDLLLSAGIKADEDRFEEITFEHVREVHSSFLWGISAEELKDLGAHSIMVLRAAVQALRSGKSAYVPMKAVHEYYEILCGARNFTPLSYTRIKQLLRELDSIGALDQEPGKGIGVAGATLKDLEQDLSDLEKCFKI
ncbi:AAA family ATPase [Candidatus Bathyarchaeota archaeon]|nr:AAA family ATPase [Candidatus Bathyarchaeota archaeon]